VQRLLVGEVIRSAAARHPAAIAVAHDGRQRSYAEVAAGSEHLAAALGARGIGRGDRVAWWGANTVDAVSLYFATAHIGAVLVPLNPGFGEIEAKPLLDLADPSIVVCDEAHAGDVTLAALLDEPPRAAVGAGVVEAWAVGAWSGGAWSGGNWAVDEEDPHMIFFTSGTTGAPKGVLLSHRTEVVRSLLGGASTWPRGATVCMFPQFHMAGWASTLEAWLSGETVVYVDGGDTTGMLDAVQRFGGYRLYCIPAVWRRILDLDLSGWDLSSLGQADTGTSATSAQLLEDIRAAFPWTTTTITYGSTEAGLVTRMAPQDVLRKPGSVGPPAPTVYVRLEDGELVVRSSHLMSGYFRNPEATAAALRDGWFYTGELAERDDEGFLRIVGRTREIIRTGGEWVAPAEVDAVLATHPALADVAVAGVPDEHWGEIVTAFVVVRPGASIELDDIRRHCENRLSAYKHPRALVQLDALPRTRTTGQIQRRALTEIALARRGA
jgi:acyl-CoA synthetase (AMP-forming)/AMP-acid ligase II